MNNEIKEILDFKENADYKKLSCDEIIVLKDYITNLQEQLHQASLDIQELTERDIECPSWCDKLTNLQQELEEYKDTETYSKRFLYKANKDRLNANLDLIKENERLKKLEYKFIDTCGENESFTLEEYLDISNKLYDSEREKENYKSRCEEARNYINHLKKTFIETDEMWDLLNNAIDILNGRSDE